MRFGGDVKLIQQNKQVVTIKMEAKAHRSQCVSKPAHRPEIATKDDEMREQRCSCEAG